MSGEIYDIEADIIEKWNIKKINKIGDTYFISIDDNNLTFSCHENYWVPFTRNFKINSLINNGPN